MSRGILIVVMLLGCSPSFAAEKATDAALQPLSSANTVAYYFHSTRRCPTCRKIEAYSADAIKKGFPQELKNGSMEWRVVNIDQPANRHFIKEFDLYASSLVLVSEEKGKPARWKNLDQVWRLVGKPEAFSRYIEDEIRQFTKGS